MNIGRLSLLILVSWLFSSSGYTLAQTPLPDSVFEDWFAVISETTLPDESVLFDYEARTFSGRTEGAMLAISFVPRFHCAPAVSLRTRVGPGFASEAVVLELTLDSERMQYGGFFDGSDEDVTYAIATSPDELDQLRKKIDVASRISIKILPPGAQGLPSGSEASETDEVDSIVFSLLGSRLATLSAEEHCRAHEPLTFNPQ